MINNPGCKAFLLVILLASAPALADAASFPARPVRLVVASAPVGILDIMARLLTPKLSAQWGQPVVIDNRAGANGVVASDTVAKSIPDGHTLLIAGPGFATNPSLYKLPYDTLKDFTVITVLGTSPNILVANLALPVKTVKDLIALAKQTPGKIIYASSAVGSGGHLSMELFTSMAGIKLVHVPYKGAGPATIGVISGESQLFATAPGTVINQVKANQLRALAVTGTSRSAALPDVPTVSESGLSGYVVLNSYVIAGPGKMAKALTNSIYGTLGEVLRMPDIVAQLNGMDTDIKATAPDKSLEFISAQVRMWEGVMKTADVRRSE